METIIVKSHEFIVQWSVGSRMVIEFKVTIGSHFADIKNKPISIKAIWFSDVITHNHYSQYWEQIDASVLKQIKL